MESSVTDKLAESRGYRFPDNGIIFITVDMSGIFSELIG